MQKSAHFSMFLCSSRPPKNPPPLPATHSRTLTHSRARRRRPSSFSVDFSGLRPHTFSRAPLAGSGVFSRSPRSIRRRRRRWRRWPCTKTKRKNKGEVLDAFCRQIGWPRGKRVTPRSFCLSPCGDSLLLASGGAQGEDRSWLGWLLVMTSPVSLSGVEKIILFELGKGSAFQSFFTA